MCTKIAFISVLWGMTRPLFGKILMECLLPTCVRCIMTWEPMVSPKQLWRARPSIGFRYGRNSANRWNSDWWIPISSSSFPAGKVTWRMPDGSRSVFWKIWSREASFPSPSCRICANWTAVSWTCAKIRPTTATNSTQLCKDAVLGSAITWLPPKAKAIGLYSKR